MPSVGATKNALLAAVPRRRNHDDSRRFDGTRSRRSRELPGGDGREGRGPGNDTIVIDGVNELHGVGYEIIPDGVVTGTLLLAGVVTRGDVTVTNCNPEHLRAILDKFVECGVVTMTGDDWIRVKCRGHHRRYRHPHGAVSGFPDRLQPQMVGFLVYRPGTSVVEESIFNARFLYVNELARMGADVKVSMESNAAVIKGVAHFRGRRWKRRTFAREPGS